ncbi:hypothetical protein MVEN_00644100 [Mycena venus]|uniref:Uncharacterized protein n=1 Tax=Mycena venus TaxID=2733690 RepID=A0A8H6YRB5_9AGAR|nr:hypothetical protein MVEN_00644100 [Mycena venus]
MSAPAPIPSDLAIAIVEAYAESIRPGFAFILIPTIFGVLMVPLLILLLVFSTAHTRRRPIFILNVVSVCMGIVSSVLTVHLTISTVLFPFKTVNHAEDFFYTCLEVWKGWFAEAVLLLRVAVVFPRSRLTLLLSFPIAIKVTRAILNIVYLVKWGKMLFTGTGNQYVVLQSLPKYLFKAIILLELVDNGYVSFLFLWKLQQQRRGSFLAGRELDPINFSTQQSFRNKLQNIFWIASTNFVFPLVFNVVKLVAVLIGTSVVLYAALDMVNTNIVIICTVFATVWSSTTSFIEAISRPDAIASVKPIIFAVEETIDAISVLPNREQTGEDQKSAVQAQKE